MSCQLSSIYSIFSQATEFFVHAWRDRRVPAIVRLVFLFTLAYFFLPFDCLPDCSPGGYLDDAAIALFLLIFIRKVVPRVVFQDARKAARHAACGIVFLGFTGLFHLHEAPATSALGSDSHVLHQTSSGVHSRVTVSGIISKSESESQLHSTQFAIVHHAVTDGEKFAALFTLPLNLQNFRIRASQNSRLAQLFIHGGQAKLFDAIASDTNASSIFRSRFNAAS